jgi:hypothetical protein
MLRFITQKLTLFTALVAVLAAQAQTPQGEPSSKYYAMRVSADEKTGNKNWVETLGYALHAKAFQDDLARRYRIILLERPDNVAPNAFSSSMKKVERRITGIKSVQVYSSGKGLSILSGQIIVVFQDGTPAADAQAKLAQFGLKIVGAPTTLLPQQFVVESPEGTNAATLVTKLAKDPIVRFAEPDVLQISAAPAK